MRDLSDAPKPGSGESLPREKVNILSLVLELQKLNEIQGAPLRRLLHLLPLQYMREGLNHDDIYIMVEDEFLFTAQLFTSHLHHAEYVRLKNAAKARNTSLHPTTDPLARPTDSITTMRAETKKKKEAEARMGKNKAALDKMRSDARSKIAVDSDEDNNIIGSEDEYEADTALWKGTSLQGLMAPTLRKNLTSLSGLQGIQSSTRAAKGYSKPEGGSQSSYARDIIRLPPPQPITRTHVPSYPSPSKNYRPTARRPSEVSSSSSSSDDLDAPHTRHPQISAKPISKSHPPPTAPKSKPSHPLTLAAADLFRPPSSAKNKPSNPFPPRKQEEPTGLPDSGLPSQSDEVAAARRRLQQRRERAAAAAAAAKKKEEDTNGSVNANEIPVFLV
ncbi:MAG: hypothetical protein Q9171_001451 [Xanthocarpia ochracea]